MLENRFLFGGIDSDSALYAIEKDSLLNSVNVRTVISKGQASSSAQFIEGNTIVQSVTDLLSPGTTTLLGKCRDATENKLYLFFYNVTFGTDRSSVIEYDQDTDTARRLVTSLQVTGGLGFTADMFVSCRASNGLLIWADGVNGPRYLSLTYDYAASAPNPQSILDLITEPPAIPLEIQRATDTAISNSIQFVPLQFTYRIVNDVNFTSVLGPDSLTALPVRESELAAGGVSFGNTVDISVDFDQKFPINWRQIDFVVRFPQGNTFFVIKNYDSAIPADVVAVDNHNNGVAQLYYNWKGVTLYPLGLAYSVKPFDNIPVISHHVELAASRLLLADNIDGYDTPALQPDYSVTQNTYQVDFPTVSATVQTYMLMVKQNNTDNWYFAVVFRDTVAGKNYLLPKDCSIGKFSSYAGFPFAFNPNDPTFGEITTNVWTVPYYISKSNLIELKQVGDADLSTLGNNAALFIRYLIVSEANDVTFETVGELWSLEYKEFFLIDDVNEFGPTGESRAFLANAAYRLGIQYYDQALRKSGVLELGSFSMIPFGPISRTLTESITFDITNAGGAPPDWAYYFSVTLSANQKSVRIIQFIPNIIKVALISSAGDIKLDGYDSLVSAPGGYEVYGLAIPLASIIPAGYGYEYTAGDFVEIVGIYVPVITPVDTPVISGIVKKVLDGYVIISYDASNLAALARTVPQCGRIIYASGTSLAPTNQADLCSAIDTSNPIPFPPLTSLTIRQDIALVTLYNGTTVDYNLFEVAKFGEVVGGAFGSFFDSGTSSTDLLGDMYTQKRKSDTGAFTCLSITTYEINNALPISDLGRITPVDRIGQQRIPTSVRWSNTNIAGTNTNGYSSFDVGDSRVIEQTAGPINGMVLTTKDVQEGGQLIILCSNGSFTALVGKQQVVNADGTQALTTESTVLGTVNPIRGGWGCVSPRSVVNWQGQVFWYDYNNRDFIQFGANGSTAVSQFKATRLWQQLSLRLTSAQAAGVSAGVNPYTYEVMVSIPAPSPSDRPALPTAPSLQDPFDCYYNDTRTYIYNWDLNKWVGSLQSGAEFINIGDDVYGWNGSGLWKEFSSSVPGSYYGTQHDAMIAVPFNEGYPVVKSPLAVRTDANRNPDEVWIQTDANDPAIGVAQAGVWKLREGDNMAEVLRNRLSNNAVGSVQWDQAGAYGARLKGKTCQVVFIWYGAGGAVFVSSAGAKWNESKGHR